MRLFLGLELPLPMRSWLWQVRPMWETQNLRWVPVENWHLTLAFLGEVEESHLPTLRQQLDEFFALQEALILSAERLEWSPSPRKARLLWLRMTPTPVYENLVRALHQLLHLPLNSVPIPHVTLLRLSQPTRTENFTLPPIENKTFMLTVVYLYKSTLTPQGALYSKLYRFPLRAG